MRHFILFIILSLSWVDVSAQSPDDSDSTSGVFGILCGYGGGPLLTMARTIRLVNNSDRSELLKLLTSRSPQSKIHGYVGFYFLQRNGFALNKTERKKMEKIEKLRSKVKFCHGCFFGLIDQLNNLISEENLVRYYSEYDNRKPYPTK